MEYEQVQAELFAWGVLEEGAPPVLSRRFRGALMRAAAALQPLEAQGRAPPGHPMLVATRLALAELGVPATEDHARFAVALEMASLPEGVLALLSGPASASSPTGP